MKLGRYEVVRELGKGAMGVVYLAKDPVIGRLVALKTIRTVSTEDDEAHEFQERFVREAQAAGILSHPAIVTVHDIGQDPESGISFIAMEYVEGANLKEAQNQGKPLSSFEAADIIAQVADALDYAHSKGIIHRDVKPANIILCGDNKAKITDFGIAKIASGATNLTTTGQFLGTPNYMAPEQIKGTRIDGRTDLFSLGIVFYEALSRQKPFGGDSLTTISYKIVHEPFPPLREIAPQLPEAFDEIIARCLAKDPADRYQRCRELAADIRAVIRGESIARAEDHSSFEETMLSDDSNERIPTIEIPFPEADQSGTSGKYAEAQDDQPFPAAAIATPPAPAPARPVTRPAAGLARAKAVTPPAIRSVLAKISPVARRKIPAPIFFGVVLLLLLPLVIIGFVIQREKVAPHPVDTARETLVQKQRELRSQANSLIRAGNVNDAYTKLHELRRIAPQSPFVLDRLQRLEQVRIEALTEQQRLDQARQTFDQGRLLYEQQEFASAIPLFEEAFHLDANLTEAVNFLKMSREQLALANVRSRRDQIANAEQTATTTRAPQTATQVPTATATANAPATLTTSFKSTVDDGYIQVKVNGQLIVYENIFQERKGFFRRNTPRDVNVRSEIPAGNVEIEVWIIIPKLRVQERRILRDTVKPGSQQSLEVLFDPDTKKLDLRLTT